MPVMDGFTATAADPRDAEQRERASASALPIIALTANVMNEDREHCLAAGMDAHLGKPIVPSQLADCLERYLGGHRTRCTMSTSTRCTSSPAAMPISSASSSRPSSRAATSACGDRRGVAQPDDFETVGKRAHALKGASANIHAHRLSAAASNLEIAARSNPLREIDGLVRELKENLQAVNAQLRKVG